MIRFFVVDIIWKKYRRKFFIWKNEVNVMYPKIASDDPSSWNIAKLNNTALSNYQIFVLDINP